MWQMLSVKLKFLFTVIFQTSVNFIHMDFYKLSEEAYMFSAILSGYC